MKIEKKLVQLQCDVCHKILELTDENIGGVFSENHFCNYKCMDEYIKSLNEIIENSEV